MHLSYKRLMSYLLLLFCSSYPRFLLSIFPSLILIFSFFFLELCITLFNHHFFVFRSSSFIFLSFVFPLLSQSWEFAYLLIRSLLFRSKSLILSERATVSNSLSLLFKKSDMSDSLEMRAYRSQKRVIC